MKTWHLHFLVITIISIMLLTFAHSLKAQYGTPYPYFGLTSIGPSWSWVTQETLPTLPTPVTWPTLASFAYSGIPDFGNFGFGYFGYPGTGAFGGYGAPVSTLNASRPFGSFGVTSMGPSWSTSLLGIPSWMIYGVAGPWFRRPLF